MTFRWHPPPELVDGANVTRFMRRHGLEDARAARERSAAEPEWFWDAVVQDLGIRFDQPWHTVLDASRGPEWADWFVGGRLNVVTNCLYRHADGPGADRACVVSEREDGLAVELSWRELATLVRRCAAGLRAAGVNRGDRVAGYMPMTEDVVIQLLACAHVGAIFIPIFSGYAPPAAAERLRDAGAVLLFTADGTYRRGKWSPIKPNADLAVADVPSIRHVVTVRYHDEEIAWQAPRDVMWDRFLEQGDEAEVESMGSMDPFLILYTSGTTGRPKGTVHSHAGTLVQVAKETGYAFDLKRDDRFFWLTDIGWMMGPWSILGGLFHGATILLYDGAFDWPAPDRLWEMVARQRISVLGLSPTAVRLARRAGVEPAEAHDLSALRILGSTGEAWDEESWEWYFTRVGQGRCPVINISGGTDIMGCFLSPLPVDPLKPCTLVGPGLGMAVDVWDEAGHPVRGEVGYLVATKPAPSMTRGLWNDPERYLEAYWSKWDGVWNHGDWARIDEDGYWFLEGRADDTLKVAGRRIGPAEVEGALMATGRVREAAAVGVPHPVKGEGIACFVVCRDGVRPDEKLRKELVEAVVLQLGRVDRPERVLFVTDLPRTRSAKILRRLVRARYLGEKDLGDLSSLQNPGALEAIDQAR